MSVSLVLTWSWVQFTLICPRKLGPYWLWHHVCKNGKNMAEPLRLCLDENVLQNFLGELQNKQTASWTTDEKIDMCFFFSLTVWTNSITWQINTYIPIHCKVDVVFPQTTNKQKKTKRDWFLRFSNLTKHKPDSLGKTWKCEKAAWFKP